MRVTDALDLLKAHFTSHVVLDLVFESSDFFLFLSVAHLNCQCVIPLSFFYKLGIYSVYLFVMALSEL